MLGVRSGRLTDDPHRVQLFGEVWQVEAAVYYVQKLEHYVVYRRCQDAFVLCDNWASESPVVAVLPKNLGVVELRDGMGVLVMLYLSRLTT